MEPARACVHAALAAGKPVVTANKGLLAEHGETLLAHAGACGADLRFEAADKLTLLARLAWGAPLCPADVLTTGLAGLTTVDVAAARASGFAWQVVASATPDCARVELARLPLDHPLARLTGTDNAVQVTTRRAGVLTLAGPGAGGDATAAAILADLDDVAPRS